MLYMTMCAECVLCSWLGPDGRQLRMCRKAAAHGQQPGVLLTLLHVGQVPAIELADEAVRTAHVLLGDHRRLWDRHAWAAHSLLDVLQLPGLRGPVIQAPGSQAQGGRAAGGTSPGTAPRLTHEPLAVVLAASYEVVGSCMLCKEAMAMDWAIVD